MKILKWKFFPIEQCILFTRPPSYESKEASNKKKHLIFQRIYGFDKKKIFFLGLFALPCLFGFHKFCNLIDNQSYFCENYEQILFSLVDGGGIVVGKADIHCMANKSKI